ncbi:MAG: carbohydrate ABC transporter permease, partial [Lacrimispora sp.]
MTKGKKFLAYGFLTVVSVISVFPLYWMLVAATNRSVDVSRGTLVFGTALIDNTKRLFASQNVAVAL